MSQKPINGQVELIERELNDIAGGVELLVKRRIVAYGNGENMIELLVRPRRRNALISRFIRRSRAAFRR